LREHDISALLLEWYDENARDLPWRIPPGDSKAGILPDPYHVWLSEIMLQQTTVAAVKKYYREFTRTWPDVGALAGARDEDVMACWAGLGYYARARNLLKCARIVTNGHNGKFPDCHKTLLSLPGIGPYTAAAISCIAFGHSETVVDGNVERVMARLFRVEKPLPASKSGLALLAGKLTPVARAGDYAQAVMDLGATVCSPKSPNCNACPLAGGCKAHAKGDAATFPVKTPKPVKPVRYGIVYLARRTDGAWLLERRPETGLLGGMPGWPGGEWGGDPVENPPFDADWITINTGVRHTFTHFHLRLEVRVAIANPGVNPATGAFIPHSRFAASGLPTVMRKAYDAALPFFETPGQAGD
jgi:A/G-specific adenine glycosylase